MTISDELTTLNNTKTAIKNAIVNKGVSVSDNDAFASYADKIGDIQTGSGSGIGITREVSATGVYQMPSSSFTFSLPSGATDIGELAMFYTFTNCLNLTNVDLSNLTTISGQGAMNYTFNLCSNLTSVDLSNLTTISGQGAMNSTFAGCTALTNVDLSNLTTISGQGAMNSTFYRCKSLTSVAFPKLRQIGVNSSQINSAQASRCFNLCENITTLIFPALEKIYCTDSDSSKGTFYYNSIIKKFYFPKLDTITYGEGASELYQNACKYIFSGCSALTEIHFGAENQEAIEATAGYSTLWGRGAGNATVYFDL